MDKSKVIFNVVLNGNDVNTYNQMPKKEKVDWIKSNTNQTDENLINSFVYGNNISERVSEKAADNTKSNITRKTGKGDSNAGQKPESGKD